VAEGRVSEEGEWSKTVVGTPQGAVISPLLANIYLHYVLDLWVQRWRKRDAKGEVIVVRYADDSVMGFQYREDAERFQEEWSCACRSLVWRYMRIRRASLSLAALRSRIGTRTTRENRRRSTFWDSRTSVRDAGKMGTLR